MGRVIAIANQKGGVGKTTTAVNIAACLALSEKNILLIDTDPQGNTTTGLGIERENLQNSLYSIYNGSDTITNLIQKTELSNLNVIPSNIDLIGAEIELISREGRETILKHAIEPIRDQYDFIFIDCPPSLSLLTLNALVAADSLIIPMQCEYYALEGISSLIRTLELVREAYNPTLDIEGILLTMFDGRNILANQVAHELRKHFGDKVYKTLIPRNITLAEAPSHGKPVILYDKRSKGAQSYLALAQEVMGHENGTG
jgi:chromosome partitioning protein